MHRLFVRDENENLLHVGDDLITPSQVAAARELVGWSQQQLAACAGMSVNSVVELERGEVDPTTDTHSLVHKVLNNEGVEFLAAATGTKGEGVRLRWPRRKRTARPPPFRVHTNSAGSTTP
jgi:ribosome-binding protein aMBF1 (putative translation factor)